MKKRIFVLCNYPFPEGMAATNRIFGYCKGLNQNGIIAEVLTYLPFGVTNKKGKALSNTFNGVTYHHPHNYDIGGSKFYRFFVDLRLFKIKAVELLIRENRKQKIDLLFISFDDLFDLFFFVPILWVFKIPLAFISDEYPKPIRQLRSSIPLYQKKLYQIVNKAFICRVVMTQALEKYYNEQFAYKPTYILNTITDIERFENIEKNSGNRQDISYVGNLELAKDNVDNIIEAFSLISSKYPSLKLNLYGAPTSTDFILLNDLVKSKGILDKVRFMGRVSYSEVPKILSDSFILVTSQPITRRAEGGFPTKLGEYLISKTPTIVTDVGEISMYIKDGVNAYMVSPCNPQMYAERLEYIINNYEEAKNVAAIGCEYIKRNFSCKMATIGLAEFIDQVTGQHQL
jgi:glycosyltransferase involved in cell wall biosynthesis